LRRILHEIDFFFSVAKIGIIVLSFGPVWDIIVYVFFFRKFKLLSL
jgi:hypothetical protein